MCGTYLSTWERPVKLKDGAQYKNPCVFSVSTSEELIPFTQKSQENWDLQYTMSESHAIYLVAREMRVYRPVEWGKGIIYDLHVKGPLMVSLSPGLNPFIAVFVTENKLYGLLTLPGAPTGSKTFHKAY
ncbi:hypothetical protein BDR04DRAFT_1106781 [Suillus decipiens]|nr:hypothetical protein BDR04DRAFT_1106781 [Suillus decipiens]